MIKFQNVSLIYPTAERTILDKLNFEIGEGEFVLLIGETGIGKSSVLRLINGLVPHHTGGILAGSVEVGGISTRTVRPGQLAELIGIVGQNPINGFVTDIVEDELAFSMEALNLPEETMRKRIEEVIDLLSLNQIRNRKIATLSGGEQQRVAIAAAMVLHPKILVLDEPTSALDPVAAEEVLAILQRLVHDLGITVIIAEHRLERVIGYVDSVIEISANGQTRIGKPEEILKDSKIAPPIVKLARALKLPQISLSVRDLRKNTEAIRNNGKELEVTPEVYGRNLIETENLSVAYENNIALQPINLKIKAGEIIALMGRNGAGKSSLIKALLNVASYKGNINNFAKRIGYIPQDANDLLYHQSVTAECEQTDRDNGLKSGTTASLLEELAPAVKLNSHPRDLSEGQRLALVLAIVLAPKPDLLVLDEPTRGLDYESKSLLIRLLTESATNGAAVFIATHDVELVAELASRIIILAEGELVADGNALDVLLASPSFAPQVTKVMSPRKWLTISDVLKAAE
ncbi:MAG: ATP-binding cassette domain-containing protein [Candidatus Nanopelagicaceae bacterium]|nr:ATP-binding cassette domain-containing protein [Candidatus Nanopelagicaceae bacterium]